MQHNDKGYCWMNNCFRLIPFLISSLQGSVFHYGSHTQTPNHILPQIMPMCTFEWKRVSYVSARTRGDAHAHTHVLHKMWCPVTAHMPISPTYTTCRYVISTGWTMWVMWGGPYPTMWCHMTSWSILKTHMPMGSPCKLRAREHTCHGCTCGRAIVGTGSSNR